MNKRKTHIRRYNSKRDSARRNTTNTPTKVYNSGYDFVYKSTYESTLKQCNELLFVDDKNYANRGFYDWCVSNYEFCLDLIDKFLKKYKNIDAEQDYMLPEDYALKDVPEKLRETRLDNQTLPMPFKQEMYDKLMTCKKFKLCPTTYKERIKEDIYKPKAHKSNSTYASFTSWYVGQVDGHNILFKECVHYPISGAIVTQTNSKVGFPNMGGSYELKAILGGKENMVLDLVRCDHNPINEHINRIDYDNLKFLPNGQRIKGTHVHENSALFTAVAPYSILHADAFGLDTNKDVTFGHIILGMRSALRMESLDKQLLSDEYSQVPIANAIAGLDFGSNCVEDDTVKTFDEALKDYISSCTSPSQIRIKDIPCDVIATGQDGRLLEDKDLSMPN